MQKKTVLIALLSAGAAWGAGAAIAAGQGDPASAAALGQIAPGQWQLREAGSKAQPRLVCLGDADQLLQLQHPGMACTRYIVDNLPRTTTVNYICRGSGNGRTMIHIETPKSFQLQTQGIVGGAPFDMTFEARRLGDCPAPPR